MPITDPDLDREYKRLWAKRVENYPKRLFQGIVKRAERRGLAILFSRETLKKWLLNNPKYIKLHRQWEKSNFQQRLAPSIYLIDKQKPYSLDNIEIVPFHVSSNRGGKTEESQEALSKNRAKLSKKIRCNETGQVFNSQAEAERELGLRRDSVRRYLKGQRKSIQGYTFAKVFSKDADI